jgi:2-hydroxy-6-oxonona-2,4-dienedioate hydrolase
MRRAAGEDRAEQKSGDRSGGIEKRCTMVDGLRIESRYASGPGEPIVLVHGLVISSLYMVPLAECLRETHEVHALDLPGFGGSEGPARALTVPELGSFVLRWMSAAGLERCHVVANSLGCQIAAHSTVDAPERIVTLTLIGATIDPAAHQLHRQVVRLIRDAMREPVRLWVKWVFDFGRAGLRRAVATTRAMFADHIENQLVRITCPTLVIRGETDPTMPETWAERATALLEKGELAVIPGQPHCAHFTVPKRVAELVVRLVNKGGEEQRDRTDRSD